MMLSLSTSSNNLEIVWLFSIYGTDARGHFINFFLSYIYHMKQPNSISMYLVHVNNKANNFLSFIHILQIHVENKRGAY